MRYNIQILQNELLRNYMRWRGQWGSYFVQPSKDAAKREWWDKAAYICEETEISPALLFFICFSYRNIRPEDMTVDFRPTIFRSTTIMRRCVTNYRDIVGSGLKQMEVVRHLQGNFIEMVAPKSTDELVRKTAELTLDYFKEKIFVYSHVFRRAGVADDPRVMDTLRYVHSKRHPFLLLLTAETQVIRELASFNTRMAMRHMPWLEDIWGNFLAKDWEVPGTDVAHLFVEEPHYYWPLDPWRTPYFVADRNPPLPEHFLHENVPDPKTDSYLLGIRDQRIRAEAHR